MGWVTENPKKSEVLKTVHILPHKILGQTITYNRASTISSGYLNTTLE